MRAAYDGFVDASAGRPFILQELGAPAGYPDGMSTIGSSPELQAEFYRNALALALEYEQARAVYSFQLIDWAPEVLQIYIDIFAADGSVPQSFVDGFIESLATLGLIDIEGKARPAWAEFIVGVENAVATPDEPPSEQPAATHSCANGLEPLRIVPLGDSITEGADHTYRYELDNLLTQAGASFDFVGSASFAAAHPATGWDMDHEGHSGWTTVEIDAQLDTWLAGYDPDVALIHLGTNDVVGVLSGGSLDTSLNAMRSIIANLRMDNANVTVFLAQILPFGEPDAVLDPARVAWNDGLHSLATELSTAESPIVTVDMATGFDAEDLADTVHPNEGGASRMASRWHDALVSQCDFSQ